MATPMTDVLKASAPSLLQFISRWQGSTLSERSAAQSHFIELCRVLGQPAPAEVDRSGAFYTFEKGAAKSAGGQGFADVWWQGKFGWEYKGHRADLAAAYQQLLQYREDLENPPLLVVSDLDRFEVHTNFTGTVKKEFETTALCAATGHSVEKGKSYRATLVVTEPWQDGYNSKEPNPEKAKGHRNRSARFRL